MINTGINLTGEVNGRFPMDSGARSIPIQDIFEKMANAVSAKVGLTNEATVENTYDIA